MGYKNEQELLDAALDILIEQEGNKFSSIKILTEKCKIDKSEAIAILNKATNIVEGNPANPVKQREPVKNTAQRTLVISHVSGLAGCLGAPYVVTIDGSIVGTIKNGAKPIVLKIDTKPHTVVAQSTSSSTAFLGKKNKFAITESLPPIVYVVPEGSENIAIEMRFRSNFLKNEWFFEEIPFNYIENSN